MRLVWSHKALDELDRLADRAPAQAVAVYEAMRWMADLGLSLGRRVPGSAALYWPVPPQGVFYRPSKDGRDLIVVAIRDARRRRRPWTLEERSAQGGPWSLGTAPPVSITASR